jgi:hypothetical protein
MYSPCEFNAAMKPKASALTTRPKHRCRIEVVGSGYVVRSDPSRFGRKISIRSIAPYPDSY